MGEGALMAKRSLSRRDFLKVSALGSSSALLSSCSTLDRYFMGDQKNLKNEVIIIGAGAAGLAAGNVLKKRKIPYKIFEASSRVGGRVQSLRLENSEGPVAEMGAEFFESNHSHIFALAKELSLPTSEVKATSGLEAHLFSFGGKTYRVKDLTSRMKTLGDSLRRVRQDLYHNQDAVITYKNTLQFERASYYDSLSLKDLLASWSSEVDPLILSLIEIQAVQHFGLDAADQSSLMFLSTLDSEGSSLLAGRPSYRMDGGLSRLMLALYRRVAGVIPDHTVKMNSSLAEVSEKDGTFELIFRTPKGKENYVTRNVICTVPFSTLRNVSGLKDMLFSETKKSMIQEIAYGTHTKAMMSFESPFWRKSTKQTPANLGNFTGDFPSQKMWDSGRGQPVTPQGLLTLQRGGRASEKVGPQIFEDAIKDLNQFYPALSLSAIERTELVNWHNKPWSKGSVLSYRPGQFAKYHGAAGEAEYGGRFQFAGEHTSLLYPGTLQGALDSGIKAAEAVKI
ncbi:Flavin-dependent L-tryptophan oxidase RebO precursor [compost metagenome]